jgi:hypothetical protein
MFESLNIIPYLKQSKPIRTKPQTDFWRRKKQKLFHLDNENDSKPGNNYDIYNQYDFDRYDYQYDNHWYRDDDWQTRIDAFVPVDKIAYTNQFLDSFIHTNNNFELETCDQTPTKSPATSRRLHQQDYDFETLEPYQQLSDENYEPSELSGIYDDNLTELESKMNTSDSNVTHFDFKLDQSDFDVKNRFVFEKHRKSTSTKIEKVEPFDLNNFYDCGIHFINKV